MQRQKPPFRADHVGSFLRTAAIKDARAIKCAPVLAGEFLAQRADGLANGCEIVTRAGTHPHTSSATSTIRPSFAHCSSSVRVLPSSVEAKPHWPDRHS